MKMLVVENGFPVMLRTWSTCRESHAHWNLDISLGLIVDLINNTGLRCKRSIRMARGSSNQRGAWLWWWLVSHTGVLQHVSPFAASPSMAVFQMLPEVVCTEEFLGLVTLSELMHMVQVFRARFPIGRIGEFFSTVAAYVSCSWSSWGGMKGGRDTGQGSTRPRMSAEMQRVLMTFGLVLVLETVWTVLTDVLLL